MAESPGVIGVIWVIYVIRLTGVIEVSGVIVNHNYIGKKLG